MTQSRESLLSVKELTKSFGGTRALRNVSMEVHSGSTHALLGPNGAGKSTLIKILDGVYAADSGKVQVRARTGRKPGRIGIIHQDLGLVEALTIRENLHLSGEHPRRGGVLIDHRREREHARQMLETVHLRLDPERLVGDLGLGERSLVAIARLLAHNADVVVLDEVTAALTKAESEWLFAQMREFTDGGGALIVVSHRLHEIVEHCDEVTLLRDGGTVYDGPTPTLHELHELFAAISGAQAPRAEPTVAEGRPVLVRARAAGAEGVEPFDLEVRSGEVVGLVGALSSSLYRVGHLLAGRVALETGDLEVHPRKSKGGDGRAGTVGFLPEDRQRSGNLTGLRVGANLGLTALRHHATGGWIKRGSERAALASAIAEMRIDPPSANTLIGSLSGGNQQKVLFGRAMLAGPDVYVLCEPTRGVDINTRHTIYDFIRRVAAEGYAVIIATIDVDDALAVSDRVALVAGERVEAPISLKDVDADALLERLS